ncbi:MAG: BatA domain-containing protein [Planctomycetota bacterium]
MSFLQPWMLAAIPLAAIPIIIHLINQRRYQSLPWGAMRFLLSANQMNRGYARIRRWLILAFRTLVIAALVLAVGRPLLSGALGQGFVGSLIGRGTETAFVLIDRSPSMQRRAGASASTVLESSVSRVGETLETMGVRRLLAIESNQVKINEIEGTDDLVGSPTFGPSSASADIPAMILAALEKIRADQLGQTDLWICSDLRENDWKSDDGRWATIRQAYSEFGRRVRFRLISSPETNAVNRSVRVTSSALENFEGETATRLSVSVRSSSSDNGVVPITIDLDGTRSTVDVTLQNGEADLVDHEIPVDARQLRCFGSVSIPADTSLADNTAFFVTEVAPPRKTAIVTGDAEGARIMKLATEIPTSPGEDHETRIIQPTDAGSIRWDEVALVIWQAPIPAENESDRAAMKAFVDGGGHLVLLPPRSGSFVNTESLFGLSWGAETELQKPMPVSTWRSDSDLLAATLSGASLPVGQLKVKRVVEINGEGTPLATLENETPLISRATTERGGVYFCATTPHPDDSSLGQDGIVLYVMLQRALLEGSRSLGNTLGIDAGDAEPATATNWRRLAGSEDTLSTENAFQQGVYGDLQTEKWFAVNRSKDEDRAKRVSDEKLLTLFDGLVFEHLESESAESGSLVEEAWRAMLILMLIAMIGEALLCLPRVREQSVASQGVSVGTGGSVA